jgi:hypothetical protein
MGKPRERRAGAWESRKKQISGNFSFAPRIGKQSYAKLDSANHD